MKHLLDSDDALTDYLNGLPPALRSGFDGALAVAGPVSRDKVALTDLGWSFSTRDLHRSLGLGSLKVVNDFAATAMAPDTDVFPVGPRTREAAGPIGIIGPGTGPGVRALIPDGRKWVIVAGEGGHVTLPSASVQPQSRFCSYGLLRGRDHHWTKGAGDRRRSCGRSSAPTRRPREQTAARN